MSFWLKYRANTPELMDAPGADPEMLGRTFQYLNFVNHTLGGYKILFSGLNALVKLQPNKHTWRILDLGCGRGDQLRQMILWAKQNNLNVQLTGLDNNPEAIRIAKDSLENDNIVFVVEDALSPAFDYSKYDIVVCTLFLHHLKDSEIGSLFTQWNKCGTNVLVNDLQRSRLALMLFKIFSTISKAPSMAAHDGLLSIRKGFNFNELKLAATNSGFNNFRLLWKWAFRYQLLLIHGKQIG